MIKSIGIVELNSIAQGVLVADCMLKAAETNLVVAKPACPGKYIILISGDVGAVKTAVSVGQDVGKNFVLDTIIIPSVHEQVIPAINGTMEIGSVNAVGVIEFFNISAAVIAADDAVKAADVRLIEVRLGMGIGGKSFVTLSGDVSAVEAAVKAGLADAIDKGTVISSCVIPSPTEELFYGLL